MDIMAVKGELAWPAQDVWAVVSDFGGLKRWNPAVLTCTATGTGVGCERVFTTRAATVTERVDDLDERGMKIGYSIVSGSTIPVRDGYLTITVRPLDARRCELLWTLAGEPQGTSLEELRQLTEKRYLGRIEDLRTWLASAAGGASTRA